MAKGCVPLVGARKLYHITEAMEASAVKLTDVHIAKLDEATEFSPGFPIEFIGRHAADAEMLQHAGVLVPWP